MSTRRLAAAASLLVALALTWSDRLEAQANRRAMYVSVLDESGAPAPHVTPADLVVREDNVAREVLLVQPATEPMEIAILVDNSQAARDYISHLRTALPPFVAALLAPNEAGLKNEVAIIGLGERPTILANHTSQMPALQKGIDLLWSQRGSGAYLLDAIVETCQGFKKRDVRRPVIVALTGEGPELSNRHYEQVLNSLRDTGTEFYALTIGTPSSSLRDEMRERATVLDRGPRENGGMREDLLTSMALTTRLPPLAEALTHQYRVTFSHPESLIPPEKTTVAAAKPGMIARGTLVREDKGKK
jgi:hypothetical protein